jgi:hypothetical protein
MGRQGVFGDRRKWKAELGLMEALLGDATARETNLALP